MKAVVHDGSFLVWRQDYCQGRRKHQGRWSAKKGDPVSGFRHGATQPPQARHSMAWRLGELSGRLANAFSGRPHARTDKQFEDRLEPPIELDWTLRKESVLAPFPSAKQGYDCDVVDQYVDELQAALVETQSELADLRGQLSSRTSITTEIERLGEQTSAILITAQDKAHDTVSRAQVDAETCVADAASYAAALREEANLERRQAEAETTALRDERARLLEEIGHTAAALSALATDASTL
jgi:DivIVA protein